MSRRAPDPEHPATEIGDVYVAHLDPPYKHAAHYTGFSAHTPWGPGLPGRLQAHSEGRGSRLMQVQHEAGGTFRIGRLYQGVTRDRETVIKESSAAKYCLICHGRPEVQIEPAPASPEPEPEAGL